VLRNALFLAVRSLLWYRGRSLTIVLCLAITLWVPFTVRMLVRQFETEILARAETTPLIIGARGSRIDLVLHGLYFQSAAPEPVSMAEVHYINGTTYADAIPLHIQYRTQDVNDIEGAPIIGTTLEYFAFRRLQIEHGESLTRLGDCVLGSRFAARTGLQPGDTLLSAPKNAFNLAGDYPLQMRVTGILDSSFSPDDDAVFVDIKTAWIIQGIGHGHQTLTSESSEQLLQSDSTEALTANASVLPYTVITYENESSFHFHGDESEFPVSEVIAVPNDRQSQTLLLGRYASVRKTDAICVKPKQVVGELLAMVFRIEQVFRISAFLSAIVTAALLGLVIFLSVRLRAPEMTTMQRIGSARGTTAMLIGTEVAIMLSAAVCLAAAGAVIASEFAGDGFRHWLF
jgi:putative ABC transport system permease protein